MNNETYKGTICPCQEPTMWKVRYTYPIMQEGTSPVLIDFGDVVKIAKAEVNSDGKATSRFARKGWNGPGQYIQLQIPDEYSKMGLPYFYICTVQGKLVPWLASQTDMLADDWMVVQ